MKVRRIIVAGLLVPCLSFLVNQTVLAEGPALKSDHPERYVIKKGDTLWDIAGRFLESPWRWPEIWDVNPDIKNPHLIYPGDVVVLTFIDGKPVLTIEKPVKVERKRATVKLSPQVRVEQVTRPVSTIPLNVVEKFLSRVQVISREELRKSPYVVALGDRHIVSGMSDRIYAKGGHVRKNGVYMVAHPGKVYKDPYSMGSPELGIEITYVAKTRIEEEGDPATGLLIESFRETLRGDRLLKDQRKNLNAGDFVPRVTDKPVSGRVISLVDAMAMSGQYQVIVLNRGSQQGLEVGHIFSVKKKGEQVEDVTGDGKGHITLPDEKVGMIMVVRAYPRMSYALVLEAKKDINVGDYFVRPE